MKIPGLDDVLTDLSTRGDEMQATLLRIEALLVKIEVNTRSSSSPLFTEPPLML